jgi:hypothetical protein
MIDRDLKLPIRAACPRGGPPILDFLPHLGALHMPADAAGQPPTEIPAAPNFDGIMQIAYIVPDLQAAVREWVDRLKVGPWFVSSHFHGTDKQYRGAPTDVDMSIAMGYWNQINVELIQQNNDVPSVYREIADKRGYGFHHWGVASNNFDADFKHYRDQGYEVAFSTKIRGFRLAYFDSTDKLPGMIELIEMSDGTRDMFGGWYRTALNWDGRDPVRSR